MKPIAHDISPMSTGDDTAGFCVSLGNALGLTNNPPDKPVKRAAVAAMDVTPGGGIPGVERLKRCSDKRVCSDGAGVGGSMRAVVYGAGLAAFLLLVLVGCSSTPSPARKPYDVSIDFLKLVQGQCMAVSSFTNRHDEPLRLSGDIRLLDKQGALIGNYPLLTQMLSPGERASHTHSLIQIFNDADLARCRSIASYQVRVSLCRTGNGRYLDGQSCVGDRRGTVTW